MATSRFLDAMRDRPMLLDAGMGLRLIRIGSIGATEDTSSANVSDPEAVRRFHEDDIHAGSDAILTNTFGANSQNLKSFNRQFGRDYRVLDINRRGVAIAREAAGPDRFVLGSIGPARVFEATHDLDVEFAYLQQAWILAEEGVDALIVETHDFESARFALRAIVREGVAPVLVSLYRWPNDAEGAARTLLDLGASVLGANCGKSTADVVGCLERLAGRVNAPLLARPGTTVDEGPDVFAVLVPKFLAMGVRLIGGCCGTTAEHLAAMRLAVDRVTSKSQS